MVVSQITRLQGALWAHKNPYGVSQDNSINPPDIWFCYVSRSKLHVRGHPPNRMDPMKRIRLILLIHHSRMCPIKAIPTLS